MESHFTVLFLFGWVFITYQHILLYLWSTPDPENDCLTHQICEVHLIQRMTACLTKFVKYTWCREWLIDSPNECAEKIVMSRRTLVPTVTQMSKKWWATRLTGQPCFLTAVTTHRSTTISNHCTKLSRQTCLASISSNSLNTAKINFATVYKTLRWGQEVLISIENVA